MKFQKRDKEAVDSIGKRLFAAAAMPDGEIERIISDPYMFARIRAMQADNAPRPRVFLRYSAVFAAIAIFAFVSVISLGLLRTRPEVASVIQDRSPADVPVAARPTNLPPRKVGSNPSQGRANYYRDADAVAERTPGKAAYSAPRTRLEATAQREDGPQFIPVAYTGDPRETAGGHIVRVEMPRSSLFALGVNVPLENDSDTVKADVLVGADGITRAIRVVK